eukprot:764868-Hanusia_phi.AAC.2
MSRSQRLHPSHGSHTLTTAACQKVSTLVSVKEFTPGALPLPGLSRTQRVPAFASEQEISCDEGSPEQTSELPCGRP